MTPTSGISASIINDGSGFFACCCLLRLLVQKTALRFPLPMMILTITDTLGLSRLAFNAAATNLEQTNAALDANFYD